MATSGGATTTTIYYHAGLQFVAEAVNGAISYLASDGLGSVTVALSASGTVQATQLYAPYGLSRYSSGTMPTDYGFTGQHADATTGLDYYNARYYDSVAGQFASADTVLDGLNRFGYVYGNPESNIDPSGTFSITWQEGGAGGNSDIGAAYAVAVVITAAMIAAVAALERQFTHHIDGMTISTTSGTSAVNTPQNSAATGTGTTTAPSGTGSPGSIVGGDPFAASVDASAIATWSAALLASLHTNAVTADPHVTSSWRSGATWVPPTW